MKKRFLTIFISIVLCLSAFNFVGCNTKKEFTVIFDKGDHPEAVLAYGYDESLLVQTVSHWSELVEPVFVCDTAYHYLWDKTISNVKSDITLKAMWYTNPFTVKFDPGAPDVTLVSGSETLTVNNVNAIVPPNYERQGYTCIWDREFIESINKDTTITPTWKPNEYKINFVDEDGTTKICEDMKVYYQQPISKLPTPTKDNLSFAAWQKLGSQTIIYDGKIYSALDDLTLKAVWVGEGEHLIIYEGVEEINNPTTYKTPTEPIKLNNPSKKGYEFLGWSGTDIDEMSLDVSIPVGANDIRTYTANWKAKEYGIALDTDGGTIEGNKRKTLVYDQVVGDLPTPEKEGFTFVGWFTNNGTAINSDSVWNIDDDSVQLIAKYTRIYTVKLSLECLVRGKPVTCTYNAHKEHLRGLGFNQVDEKTFVWENVAEGTLMPVLPNPRPLDSGEYAFSAWKYTGGTKPITIKAGTPINENKFPGTYDSGEIVLVAQCYALWTPFY